jgi:hypothetical protein
VLQASTLRLQAANHILQSIAFTGQLSCEYSQACLTSTTIAAGDQLSSCFGSTKVVIHPNEALPRDQALAFCKARHGEGATLPETPDAIAAAQRLIYRANVRFVGWFGQLPVLLPSSSTGQPLKLSRLAAADDDPRQPKQLLVGSGMDWYQSKQFRQLSLGGLERRHPQLHPLVPRRAQLQGEHRNMRQHAHLLCPWRQHRHGQRLRLFPAPSSDLRR